MSNRTRDRRVWGLCCLLAGVIGAAGCGPRGVASDPRQAVYLAQPITERNECMDVLVAGFVVDPKADPPEVRYSLLMKFAERYDHPTFLHVDFDDPAAPRERIRVVMELPPNSEYFTIDSDPVRGMRYKWNYWVRVGLYEDADGQRRISELAQRIRSNVDWERLLQEGPDAFPLAQDIAFDEDVMLRRESIEYWQGSAAGRRIK